MGIQTSAAVVLLASVVFRLALPAQGQITSVVNDRGRIVYINANPPARRPVRESRSASVVRGSFFVPAAHQTKAAPVSHPTQDRLQQIVEETAKRHQLDPRLVRAVITAESDWNPAAISSKGALGLMQLNPSTAERYGVGNVFDPAQNIEGGVRYLAELLERYQGDLKKSLAAYNAGENAVDRAGGVPNYPETRAYVRKITNSYFQPGSSLGPDLHAAPKPHPIYRTVDEKGRVVFTNE